MDTNGVSSGNVEAVFERNEDRSLTFSPEKLEQSLSEAKNKGAHTLLLSSEFFFKRLEPLFTAAPDAVALAYVRDPLETMESGYNQGVKRHFQTEVFDVPDSPKTGTLDYLDKLIGQFGISRFVLRAYDRNRFTNQDVVSDFCEALNMTKISQPQPANINPSYVFEALEFKRWFNQLPDTNLHHLLDRFCQGYKNGQDSFSLLSDAKRSRVRQNIQPQMLRFVERYKLQYGAVFLTNLTAQDKREFRKQGISEAVFQRLLLEFLEHSGVDKERLEVLLWEYKQNIEKQPELHGVCTKILDEQRILKCNKRRFTLAAFIKKIKTTLKGL
ncbi:MAG: hypothetical protein GYB58_12145 [Gammaproteobacteria bacterium]|nr:hypothetical protein [Gammaproteobacteria bacterium]